MLKKTFFCINMYKICIKKTYFLSYSYLYLYIYSLVLCFIFFFFFFFALSIERTCPDLHFTTDYTLCDCVCDK